MENSKELFASLIVKNAKDFSNENLKQDEVIELLTHDTSFKLMYKLCLEFSATVNELSESKVYTLQAELEKAKELLKECQDRLETILVIGVERDEVNMLIKKINTENV